jgi:non-specific serine/threonine protein kinase
VRSPRCDIDPQQSEAVDLRCFVGPDRGTANWLRAVQSSSSDLQNFALPVSASDPPVNDPKPSRNFGRFELLRPLGKSSATISWLTHDRASGQQMVLCMPRWRPADVESLEQWLHEARRAARLTHPNLAPVREIGVQDHWPFVAYERGGGHTLAEWLAEHPRPPPGEVVGLVCQALEGLAFAHEAGVIHGDVQLHHLFVDADGHVRLAALDIVLEAPVAEADGDALPSSEGASVLDPAYLRMRRDAAQRDVLSIGLVMHHLLAARPPLDEADVGCVVARMPPLGRETVRLPLATPCQITDALRAIAARATNRQSRQRYLNARTMWRALDGWLRSEEQQGSPPVQLLDRLRAFGHLPAPAGAGMLGRRLSGLEARHALELAEPILRDIALSLELLRLVNSARVQGNDVTANGPVLTIQRTLALLGLDGVRQAAASLRPWPGPLDEAGAAALQKLMDQVRLAAFTAQALRPRGFDGEVIYLIALLQNLGRLIVRYHFSYEAEQIEQLMQPSAAADAGTGEGQGMSEEWATYAVLGVDCESIGAVVALHWGLNGEVVHLMRRLPTNRPVFNPDGDADLLRAAASAANEAVDAITHLPAGKAPAALAVVVQRYGRPLGITMPALLQALHDARVAVHGEAGLLPAVEGEAAVGGDTAQPAAADEPLAAEPLASSLAAPH